MLLTRSPLIQNQQADPFTVRLACVKHAASVRPEPGSNSPNKTNKNKPQPTTNYSQPEPTVSTTVQKTRPGPTQPHNKEGQANQNKTKPQKPHTTKIMRSPQGHGIKNMTHYRVLKQHTQPELNQAFGLNFALASNSATLEHLSVRRQPQKYCSRSHRSTLCRSDFAAGGSRGKPGPFGSGLYFRQVHPTDVKPIAHDPRHTDFSVPFQPLR